MATGEQLPHDLDEVLFGEQRQYTSREVAALAGVPVYRARRFWRALGLPDVGDDEVEFTSADVSALMVLLRMLDEGLVDDATALQLTRSVGQAAARLADSQTEFAARGVDDAGLVGTDRLRAVHQLGRRLLPGLEELLIYAWRRHLGAAANRLDQVDQTPSAASLAVGFADLVAFTRLSRQLELTDLADLVERFESRSADVVAHTGGRVVKTLGDSVLFVAKTPELAAETALRLIDAHAGDPSLPPLRVGVAYGPVVSRMGDVFGSTVNLASRLTALADPDSVVIDVSMAQALWSDEQYELAPIRRRAVRGFGRIAPFALCRRSAPSEAILPSPRMML